MTPPDTAARIAELEAELSRVKAERDLYKAAATELFRPDEPQDLTAEEIQDMLTGPRGQPLLEVIAEFEQRGRS